MFLSKLASKLRHFYANIGLSCRVNNIWGCNSISCKMSKAFTSDYDLAEEIFLSELLDGHESGDLQELDSKFAEQLHFQDAIFFSVTENISSSKSRQMNTGASSSMSKSLPKKSARKARESSLSYCEICVDRKQSNQMFPISGCSHSFCSDCISMHIKARLEEHVTIIPCPGENCRILLELEPCRALLPKEMINLWADLLCEELLCATGGRLYCPFKDCSALLLNDNQGEVIAETECPFCHRLFCAPCNVPWHPGISCDEYQNLNENERGRDDIMVKNLAKEKKWRRCPSCHIIVERTEGCLHMTCRCKFEFCYACGAQWTHDHGGCQGN